MLGSSLYGAQLAAALGLPYAFASHFAPEQIGAGRSNSIAPSSAPPPFWPSRYVMLGLNVVAADTDARGQASVHVAAAGFRQSAHRQSRTVAAAGRRYDVLFRRSRASTRCWQACLGWPRWARLRPSRQASKPLSRRHRPDELMVTGQIFDHAARLRSYEILSALLLTTNGRPRSANEPNARSSASHTAVRRRSRDKKIKSAFTKDERADRAADNIFRPVSPSKAAYHSLLVAGGADDAEFGRAACSFDRVWVRMAISRCLVRHTWPKDR